MCSPLLRQLPSRLASLPGDNPFSALSLSSSPFLPDPGGYKKACYSHVVPLYLSTWFHRASCVQCQLQIAPLSSELCGCGWQAPSGHYLDDNGLSWAFRSLTSNCSAVPHALAGEVVSGAGFAAAGSQFSCVQPPPGLAKPCRSIGVS